MEIETLFMEQCVFLILEDVCLVTILPEEMQTWEHAHIHAAGNIMLWKKAVRANIFLWKRMKEVLIFLIQRSLYDRTHSGSA